MHLVCAVLQEHFETQEDAMVASAIKAGRRDRTHPSHKGDAKVEAGQDGRAIEGDGEGDDDDDDDGDARGEAGAAAAAAAAAAQL